MSDAHEAAAQSAVGHLKAAWEDLAQAFTHPHHSHRLDAVRAQLDNTASVIEAMPSQEESRADHAARIQEALIAGRPPQNIHEQTLLAQEAAAAAVKAG